MEFIGVGVACLIVGFVIAWIMSSGKHKAHEEIAKKDAELLKQRLMEEARGDAAKLKADSGEELIKKRREFDKELVELKEEVRNTERRLEKREELIDRKLNTIERREQDFARKEQEGVQLETRRQELLKDAEAKNGEMTKLIDDERRKLVTISSLTPDQARTLLLKRVEQDIAGEVNE